MDFSSTGLTTITTLRVQLRPTGVSPFTIHFARFVGARPLTHNREGCLRFPGGQGKSSHGTQRPRAVAGPSFATDGARGVGRRCTRCCGPPGWPVGRGAEVGGGRARVRRGARTIQARQIQPVEELHAAPDPDLGGMYSFGLYRNRFRPHHIAFHFSRADLGSHKTALQQKNFTCVDGPRCYAASCYAKKDAAKIGVQGLHQD